MTTEGVTKKTKERQYTLKQLYLEGSTGPDLLMLWPIHEYNLKT